MFLTGMQNSQMQTSESDSNVQMPKTIIIAMSNPRDRKYTMAKEHSQRRNSSMLSGSVRRDAEQLLPDKP